TDKQKRQAEHIETSYESRGVSSDEAERRAWATVNKESGGGKKSGSGRGHAVSHESSRRGGGSGGPRPSPAGRPRRAKKGRGAPPQQSEALTRRCLGPTRHVPCSSCRNARSFIRVRSGTPLRFAAF